MREHIQEVPLDLTLEQIHNGYSTDVMQCVHGHV